MLGFINQRLSIGIRLALVGGIFAVFAGVTTVSKVMDGNKQIEFSQKELRGAEYVTSVWHSIATGQPAVLQNHAAYDQEFDTAKNYQDFAGAKTKSARNKAAVTLLTAISDSSNLVIDPRSDTNYLGLVYSKDLPSWLSSIDKLFKLMNEPASEKRDATLKAALDSFSVRKTRVVTNYANAAKFDQNGATTAAIKPKLAALMAASAAVENGIDHELQGQDADTAALSKQFEDAMYGLSATTGDELTGQVNQHIAGARTDMRNVLLANLGFIIPSLALIAIIMIGLSQRFHGLDEAMNRLNQGDKTVEIPYQEDTNETGRIAATLVRMKQDIIDRENAQIRQERERLAAGEAQKAAEAEAQRRSEALVVGTFGEGLKALAEENLSFRLTSEVPAAYQALKDNFNQAIATSEANRAEREAAARQREADQRTAEAARKQAEEEAHRKSVDLVVSSFGEGLSALAERNLSYRLDRTLPEEYRGLQRDFNNALEQLENAMRDIGARTADVSANSREISNGAQDMAKRTEQQAAALEETAAAINEVTATVGKSAESAKQANTNAKDAREDAERGNKVVQNAVDAMRAIAKSSNEITQIIGVIDEIAFQTNLLALNAGVEAARAGDAGRGFAVVASEVRALAQRSAEAAKQIKALIQASETQVDIGVKLVGESGTALEKIVSDIGNISKLMGEIATSQKEQATAMGEIDTAIGQMDQSTQQNAAMAEQSNASSEALAGYAKELADVVARFKLHETRQQYAAE